MAFRDYLPFQQAPTPRRARSTKTASTLAPEDQAALAKIFKVAGLALGFQGGGAGASRASFEVPRYPFLRILQAVDTDSYIKQGIGKYRELMWKEGWKIKGENPDAVTYIHTRFDYMEVAMRRPIQDLFSEIADQLVKFGNAFVVKSRGDLSKFFPMPLNTAGVKGNKFVVGYYVLPAETVQIARDANNIPQKYRQLVQGGGGGNPPEFNPEDVIHFAIDKKPGRAFGTPFLVAALDDVVALRQIEEDAQNLVHKELFPLYTYQVGTPENPADPTEIDKAVEEIGNLRTDGGLVIPERHKVEVLGADGKALDISGYLQYFKERVVVGLGLSEHHLGMTNKGGNRAIADRLDVALYDKVKMYQRYFSNMVRLNVLNDLLLEGGFDPMITPTDDSSVSDRCEFLFHEIDVDTQIKKENAVLQKWTANAITLPETRLELGESYDPEADEAELFLALQARMVPGFAHIAEPSSPKGKPVQVGQPKGSGAGGTAAVKPAQMPVIPAAAQKGDKAVPSTGGKRNLPNAAQKAVGNKSRPQNQHGRRLSPNVRHDDDFDDNWLSEVVELLDNDEEG